MTTVEGLLLEIEDIGSLICARPDNAALHNGMISSVTAKIATIRSFGTGQPQRLYNAVAALAISAEFKGKLSSAVDARLGSGMTTPGTHNGFQHMRFMLNYLTQNDWTQLRSSTATVHELISIICARVQIWGVVRPSDDGLIKWACTLLIHLTYERTHEWPLYKTIYGWVQDIKQMFSARRVVWLHDYIDVYPEFPSTLPVTVQEAACGADDPPVRVVVSRFEMLSQHVVLRKDNKYLIAEAARGTPHGDPRIDRILCALSSSSQHRPPIDEWQRRPPARFALEDRKRPSIDDLTSQASPAGSRARSASPPPPSQSVGDARDVSPSPNPSPRPSPHIADRAHAFKPKVRCVDTSQQQQRDPRSAACSSDNACTAEEDDTHSVGHPRKMAPSDVPGPGDTRTTSKVTSQAYEEAAFKALQSSKLTKAAALKEKKQKAKSKNAKGKVVAPTDPTSIMK